MGFPIHDAIAHEFGVEARNGGAHLGALSRRQQRIVPCAAQQAFGRERDIEHASMHVDIAAPVQQDAVRRLAVPSSSSRFLIVRFRRAGQRPVRHEPHARRIDAHPECARGDDDIDVLGQEAAQDAGALIALETCVIRQRGESGEPQRAHESLGHASRAHVDDRDSLVRAQQRHEPFVALALVADPLHGKVEVLPVERAQYHGRPASIVRAE
jgi:hypothetical protein